MTELMDIQHVSAQAGHNDINETMGYRRAPEVNQQFRNIDLEIF